LERVNRASGGGTFRDRQHLRVSAHLLDMEGIVPDVNLGAAIVERAAAGDRAAFARIVVAHHADMVRVAYVVAGGSQDLADDAVQAAWAVAWRKLGSVRDPDRLRSWLVAVAANEARQLSRKRRVRRLRQIQVGPDDPHIVGPDRDPADRDAVLDLQAALQHLSSDERRLLALRYEVGLDSREIGRLIGRPAATVRWRLSRLVSRLRKELRDG
jgi:RNA polymerase sigma-70 factor, ECF subfamily